MKCMQYREQEILLFLLFSLSLSLLAVTVSEREGSVSVSERPFSPFQSISVQTRLFGLFGLVNIRR